MIGNISASVGSLTYTGSAADKGNHRNARAKNMFAVLTLLLF